VLASGILAVCLGYALLGDGRLRNLVEYQQLVIVIWWLARVFCAWR
jgi:hypothetical protein